MEQSNCIDDGGPAEARFGEFFRLSDSEGQALATLPGRVQSFPRGHVLRRDGVEPTYVYLLLEGWAASSIPLPSGKQQTVKIHLPRDLMGAPSLCLVRSVDRLTAITPIVVRTISRSDLMSMIVRFPRIAASIFLSSQKERIALMASLAIAGQSEGLPRVAGMLADLYERLSDLGLAKGTRIPFPLTQQQVGDLVGLSQVHVNRVLKQMDQDGLLLRDAASVSLLDIGRLRAIAGLPERVYQRDPQWVRFD